MQGKESTHESENRRRVRLSISRGDPLFDDLESIKAIPRKMRLRLLHLARIGLVAERSIAQFSLNGSSEFNCTKLAIPTALTSTHPSQQEISRQTVQIENDSHLADLDISFLAGWT